ncbi:TonB-dependent receptor family protein [Azohydromonas caseinilytica]|uniref:TonB-dependent receptor n=1 Tax=Azohydromonas caseinilytica TaxID=2728836 RepID=A0A848F4Q0_9BURK|nr:TonB-dependent receptor [Azohydromonas caseinilytica]NML15037.1 TonB-dependent receptor [Azohydromonas caseinilytica]
MNIRVFPLTPRLRPCVLACAAALLSLGAAAQQGASAQEGGAAAPGEPAQVVVTGSVRERVAAEVPYAIGVVGREELRAAGPMINLSEALSRVPGLIVNNRNNYAQDLQVSSRGFGARATFGVRGLRLYSDGIPASMPDGQGQVSHFDLAGASRIEVLRGPFSVLYGNSSGGVIALFSAPVRERQGEVALDVGSDGLRQLRGSVEAPLGGGFDLRVSGTTMQYDGFRPNMEARRRTLNARLGWQGESDRVIVQAGYFAQPAQDPLGLTAAQFAADPYQTTPEALAFNTRKDADQTQLGASWKHSFGEGALRDSQVAVYSGRRSVTQWQAIPVGAQTSPRSGGGVIDFDRDYRGVDARLRWGWDKLDLLTGVAVETQEDDRRGYQNFIGTGAGQQLGVTGALRRDERNRATTRDVYAQLDWSIAPTLTASAGVRSGEVKLRTRDNYIRPGNPDDSGDLSFNYTNPVLGLRWQALPSLQLHASAARGFESPTLTELAYQPGSNAAAGFNTALQPQTSRQFELGAKWRAQPWEVDAALFRADVDDEISVASNTGGRASYKNVGRTRRQGVELSTTWRPQAAWRAQLGLTYLDASYRDPFLTCVGTCAAPTLPVAAGNRIAGTQRTSAFGEVAWRDAGLGEWALEARALGRTAANDVNDEFAPGFVVTNLRWAKSWPMQGGRKVELLARVDNLADKAYAGSVIVNEGNRRYYETAAPRSFLLGVRVYGGF